MKERKCRVEMGFLFTWTGQDSSLRHSSQSSPILTDEKESLFIIQCPI